MSYSPEDEEENADLNTGKTVIEHAEEIFLEEGGTQEEWEDISRKERLKWLKKVLEEICG